MSIIGYARISTTYQRFDSQLEQLKNYGCEKIYRETESGTSSKRPVLSKILKKLKFGDTFVIYRLDRLSRGTKYLLELMDTFEKKGIHFVSINDNIDTSTAMGKFFFTIMGAFAEMEASLIRERVISGLEATKKKGTVLGRPQNEDNKKRVQTLSKEGLTIMEIHQITGCSRSTIYRYLDDRNNNKNQESSKK